MPVARQRLLLKLAHDPGAGVAFAGTSFAVADASFELKPLFEVRRALRSPSSLGLAGGSPRTERWYLAEPDQGTNGFAFGGQHPWDLAHQLLGQPGAAAFAAVDGGGAEIIAVEPDLEQPWPIEPPSPIERFAAGPSCQPDPQRAELPHGDRFGWHLEDGFSGLAAARELVAGDGPAAVTIVHLDTGYDPEHKALPAGLDRRRQRNFVPGEPEQDATDRTEPGPLHNPGHGTGTIGILAGGVLDGMRPPEASTGQALGGAPLASIVPVRIANSVVHLWTSSVAQGIDYARRIGADVISMSMGGIPSAAWADAVNAAYEAGITIVCAAGNNFGGLPTRFIVYPARFGRVLAACGVMADGTPYYNLPPNVMQGNFGPTGKMATAMAAFTPNIPWLKRGCADVVDLDGAGTSAATPQLAAAAALWLQKNGSALNYAKPWMRVEAVRRALFLGAGSRDGTPPHEYFGRGIVKARATLDQPPARAEELVETARDSASFAFLRLATGLGMAAEDRRRQVMLELELTQLALTSRAAAELVPDPDLPAVAIPELQRQRFLGAILDEGKTSLALRRHLELRLDRPPSVQIMVPPPAPAPAPVRPQDVGSIADAPLAPVPAAPTGTQLPRRISRLPPPARRLRIFTTDPSFGARLDTASLSVATAEVPWECDPASPNLLRPGPVGEYLEVVDVDPASGVAYAPVDLNDPFLLATDGLTPSEGNPQFHQQMVYAVAMRTIQHFEHALGRRVLWAAHRIEGKAADGGGATDARSVYRESHVRRLRVYPHALRQANAYYSPDKVALLFGYFPAATPAGGIAGSRGLVFTCLSHDVVAHETTHAVLDGLHRRYQESTNPDVLAFHEAFADIVAIFQHFTYPELLRHALAQARGDLGQSDLLAQLARQFGEGLGRSAALRSAIGQPPGEQAYATIMPAHERGAILVAAVFDAFLKIYHRRSEDLMRLASGGTGVLRPGALHPDLIARLAEEAAKSARHVLQICMRAVDYCPPVDITFSDYLRALITADSDLVPDDDLGYRVAFLEAFRARGIFATDVRALSVESLRWQAPAVQPAGLGRFIAELPLDWTRRTDRLEAYNQAKASAARLHAWLAANLGPEIALQLGLNRARAGAEDGYRLGPDGRPKFEVHSVRPARRVTPDGELRTDLVAVITQWRTVPLDPDDPRSDTFIFRGGCTLLIDPQHEADPIRYAVVKSVLSDWRADCQRRHLTSRTDLGLDALYFGDRRRGEPFALLHLGH